MEEKVVIAASGIFIGARKALLDPENEENKKELEKAFNAAVSLFQKELIDKINYFIDQNKPKEEEKKEDDVQVQEAD